MYFLINVLNNSTFKSFCKQMNDVTGFYICCIFFVELLFFRANGKMMQINNCLSEDLNYMDTNQENKI